MYLLWDKFCEFGKQNPDVALELACDIRFVDIVKEKFDAGIRTGDVLNQDVLAVKISDENTMCLWQVLPILPSTARPKRPQN
ncbi:hypothetical protein [Alysiella crassa]|uniref:Uncharacterized protein n=1 Tax=Alysiella crassa TaxID=153491 RepID=A0A376BN01_9NEIS|nr:hypothetical protein [Alysiella crassa]UOP06836.1 hypothetical protein LVJ80_14230 [Alysiella crassa]SSY71038.1 Uncharacterised protein [Alysiella crassa]